MGIISALGVGHGRSHGHVAVADVRVGPGDPWRAAGPVLVPSNVARCIPCAELRRLGLANVAFDLWSH